MKNPQTVSNSHPKPGLGSQKIQVRSLESVCRGFRGWLCAQLRTSQGSGRHGMRSSPLLFTHLYQAIANAPHSTAHALQEGKPQGRRIRWSVQVGPRLFPSGLRQPASLSPEPSRPFLLRMGLATFRTPSCGPSGVCPGDSNALSLS